MQAGRTLVVDGLFDAAVDAVIITKTMACLFPEPSVIHHVLTDLGEGEFILLNDLS